MNVSRRSIVAAVAMGAVIGVVIAGLLMLRTPAEERPYLADQNRLDDLHALESALDLYWTRYESLPDALEDLRRLEGVAIRQRDPVTSQPYEYRVLDPTHYELCAVFERDSSGRLANFWSHGTGRRCFRIVTRDRRRNPF